MMERKIAGVMIAMLLFLLPCQSDAGDLSRSFRVVEQEAVDGRWLAAGLINGPPKPPAGALRPTARVVLPQVQEGIRILTVPAYSWSFGCSATSAAMIAAYYDRGRYPDMYQGPTNNGVMPLDNSVWGEVVLNGEALAQCPLSATRNGLDGRTVPGHVDDYWILYGATGPDPYEGVRSEHAAADCVGDFMRTNKWFADQGFNTDGGTVFYNYSDGSPLTAAEMEAYGIQWYDGGYGQKRFFESRGYQVTTMYNQYIYGYDGAVAGFTYQQYKEEIDAGRPVMIHVRGHTMVGVGYDDTAEELVYLNDTWDHTTHTMTWGGSYAGMLHYAVTIVQLEPPPFCPAPLHLLLKTPPP